ncbi:Polyketide cyclase / dehydrase and lipid transport [Mycobacterium sp. JS623]|uniref:SRPBCC family protein n=1 Tax=Mycobacterium sp. JS623 TaxID=212767 RepID=UPI0002A5B729|nr:SRPBCC family protein [Mycobacterium sp. JS623]AGB25687.1 Polyketide cyclase / dehydrase and lipid transport [Mycobacterium sp. JS623]
MAVRASREVVFEATPEAILDALADIDSVPTWSSVHKHAEVLDRHPDGKPRHVRATFKIMGITDKEVLEYNWGPRWMVWDAKDTFQQRGQHVEYNLTPEGEEKTRVRFDIILDLAAPIPDFLIKRAKKIVLDVATESLRKQVMEKYAS